MKKFLKVLLYLVGALVLIGFALVIGFKIYFNKKSKQFLSQAGLEAPLLVVAGENFRDLNKNGALDVYEDFRRPVEERVADILRQMTLEEKAGMMFINMIAAGRKGELMEIPTKDDMISLMVPSNSEYVIGKKMNHFNVLDLGTPELAAKWMNNLQKLAERTRLGIPVTMATDPRHSFSKNIGFNLNSGSFSQWPEPIGLAATRDTALVREFGNIARQEYLAVGIRLALHPMADLATEPRWPRIDGTFGEDAALSSKMLYAYIKGFQGDSLGEWSVAAMTKHFAGGGPQKDGMDPHFEFGKEQIYPGNNFDYHLIPFEKGAFAAGTAQIMPYYGIPMDQTSENVGFAFNKDIITGLLREKYGFDGVVCTDWSLLTDKSMLGRVFLPATGWGVEDLTLEERILKAIDAGIDQFGGESIPEVMVELVTSGRLSESRLDESVRRLLRDKFQLGLFDDPYVDVENAGKVVGKPEFIEKGIEAQRKSLVLLKKDRLPLNGNLKLYIENIDPEVAGRYGEVVATPEEADFAILRLETPFYPVGEGFAQMFKHGDLDFKGEEKARILGILGKVPTIVDIKLSRPAVIPEIADKCVGLIGNFAAGDQVILDLIFGQFNPSGKLPFELPASMEAVENQIEDIPYDSKDPLYPFGYCLSY